MMDAGRPTGTRGAANRVAAAQRQVRPAMVSVVVFLGGAAVVGALPHDTGRWLPLHIALVGALVLAISGATQFLAVTWGAAPAPDARLSSAQRWLVVTGALLVTVGRESELDAMVVVGGAAVAAALLLLVVLLVEIGHGAIQPRVRPAVAAYVTASLLGVAGAVLGAVMGGGGGGHLYGRVRDVHQTLNLLGFAGFAVAGTLPFFVATQAKVKMSARATRRAQFGVQVVMGAGIAAAVVGLAIESHAVVAVGLAGYVAALAYLITLLPRVGTKQFRWAGPRLVQAGAAVAWWIGGAGLACARAVTDDPPFGGAVVPALVLGGYVQLIVAALSYLGPVLVGGGHERLARNFRRTRSWVGLVAGNVAALAATASLGRAVYVVAIAAWTADGLVRAGLLLRGGAPDVRSQPL